MYFVTKTFSPDSGISCIFRQHRSSPKNSFLRGHTLVFTATFGAEELDKHGQVLDFDAMTSLRDRVAERFHNKLVIAEDDPYLDELSQLAGFGLADPIVLPHVGFEVFALWLAAEAADVLSDLGELGREKVLYAKVHEHGENHSGYSHLPSRT